MSEFSNACRKLIEQSNTNVYQIAKRSGLDRTTLQKMVQGTRLPSRQFVEQLCDFLPINASEREELLRLFRIEKIGRERYCCRCEVEKLLCGFRDLRDSFAHGICRRTTLIERIDAVGGQTPLLCELVSETEVIDAARYVILHAGSADAEGAIPVYMDMFPHAAYAVCQILQEEEARRSRIRCCQFVDFYHHSSMAGGMQQNVRTLRRILSFAFAFPEGYEIRYFYRSADEPDGGRIWPHYLVTGQNVLLMAEDGCSGILIENEEIAAAYLARLQRMRLRGRNLLSLGGSPDQLLSYYADRVFTGRMTLSFDTMLCMGDLFPALMAQREGASSGHTRDDNASDSQDVISDFLALCDRRGEEGTFDPEYRRVFCMKGLEDFVRTGVLPGIFGDMTGIFTPQQRADALTEYCTSAARRQDSYLLRDNINVPAEGLCFELYEPDRVFIYSVTQGMRPGCICIEEPGAYEVFRDYFFSLEEEGKVYGPQESSRILTQTCNALIEKYGLRDAEDAGGTGTLPDSPAGS